MRKAYRMAAAATAAALSLGTLLAPPAQAASTTVTGVQFRWGINNESNNRSAAPGTYNLLSAGKLGNPGAGSQMLDSSTSGATWTNGAAANWRPDENNVHVQKLQADNSYAAATWAGTRTDKNGAALGSYSSATVFSGHQVVIDNGTGTLDATADDADLNWQGDFTVVYYSGYTFYYVSNPHLVVTHGAGTLTATVSGYGSDMDDPSRWNTLAPRIVTLATMSGIDVSTTGFVTTPAYRGVTYDAPSNATPQVRTGADWGSFPSDFTDFQQLTGQGSYWYSSGSAVDRNKVPLPLTVTTTPAVAKVKPTVTVTSSTTSYGHAGTVRVTVSAPGGRSVAGTVTLSGAGAAQNRTLTSGKATFTLSRTLAPRTYTVTAKYAGSSTLTAAQASRSQKVTKATPGRPTLTVTKKPTTTKSGTATVTVRSGVTGLYVSGRATITLARATTSKKVTVTLRSGTAKAVLPKLAKGAWRAVVRYSGSANHVATTSATYSVKIG